MKFVTLDWLAMAEFAYNNKVQTSIKVSLFRANNRHDPQIGFELRKKKKFEKAKEFVQGGLSHTT